MSDKNNQSPASSHEQDDQSSMGQESQTNMAQSQPHVVQSSLDESPEAPEVQTNIQPEKPPQVTMSQLQGLPELNIQIEPQIEGNAEEDKQLEQVSIKSQTVTPKTISGHSSQNQIGTSKSFSVGRGQSKSSQGAQLFKRPQSPTMPTGQLTLPDSVRRSQRKGPSQSVSQSSFASGSKSNSASKRMHQQSKGDDQDEAMIKPMPKRARLDEKKQPSKTTIVAASSEQLIPDRDHLEHQQVPQAQANEQNSELSMHEQQLPQQQFSAAQTLLQSLKDVAASQVSEPVGSQHSDSLNSSQCAICMQPYNSTVRLPRMMPSCRHTICQECLGRNESLKCFICRAAFPDQLNLKLKPLLINWPLLHQAESNRAQDEIVEISQWKIPSVKGVPYASISSNEFKKHFKKFRAIALPDGKLLFDLIGLSHNQAYHITFAAFQNQLSQVPVGLTLNETWFLQKFKHSVVTESSLCEIQSLLPDFYLITFNQPDLNKQISYSTDTELPKLFDKNLRAADNIVSGSRDQDQQKIDSVDQRMVLRQLLRDQQDFTASPPPKNDEIKILGFSYKQPSTHSVKRDGKLSNQIKLDQNYYLQMQRPSLYGSLRYHAIIEIKCSKLVHLMTIFSPETQLMISEYYKNIFPLFKQFTVDSKFKYLNEKRQLQQQRQQQDPSLHGDLQMQSSSSVYQQQVHAGGQAEVQEFTLNFASMMQASAMMASGVAQTLNQRNDQLMFGSGQRNRNLSWPPATQRQEVLPITATENQTETEELVALPVDESYRPPRASGSARRNQSGMQRRQVPQFQEPQRCENMEAGNGILRNGLSGKKLQFAYQIFGQALNAELDRDKDGMQSARYYKNLSDFKDAYLRSEAIQWLDNQFFDEKTKQMKAHTPLNTFIVQNLKKGKSVTAGIIAKRESYLVANWKESKAYLEFLVKPRRSRSSRQSAQQEPDHSSHGSREEEKQFEEDVSGSQDDEVKFMPKPPQELPVAQQPAQVPRPDLGEFEANPPQQPLVVQQPAQVPRPGEGDLEVNPPRQPLVVQQPAQVPRPGEHLNETQQPAFMKYARDCKTLGIKQRITSLEQWAAWLDHRKQSDTLQSPVEWAWWQNFMLCDLGQISEQQVRGYFDMCYLQAQNEPIMMNVVDELRARNQQPQ